MRSEADGKVTEDGAFVYWEELYNCLALAGRRGVKYDVPPRDEWFQPRRRGYRMMCCDCGLVHEVDFRVYKRRVQLRVRRNNRATAAARRKARYKGEGAKE